MNEHLYIVQTEDIVEAINVMITRKKNPKINKQAYLHAYMYNVEIF